jgi:hypothetical protein
MLNAESAKLTRRAVFNQTFLQEFAELAEKLV